MQIGDTINVMKACMPRNRFVRRALLLCILFASTRAMAQIASVALPPTNAHATAVTARAEPGVEGAINPAALDMQSGGSVHFASTPLPLGLPGVVESALVAAIPVRDGMRATAIVTGYGDGRYLESMAAGGLAIRLTDRFRAGARLRLHMLSIHGYRTRLSTAADLGVLADLEGRFRLGLSVTNLLQPRPLARSLPPALSIGVASDLDSTAILSVDLHQELGREPALAIGLSFEPAADWTLRLGLASEPFRLAAGAGVKVDDIGIDIASIFIESAGMRHSIGAGFYW